MSGGKGGSTTSSVTIPEYIEAAAQRNLNKAERISQIGYTPYYGPDVAAFTPMQQAGFQNIADTAGAFGLAAPTTQQDIMGGMGPATTYAGGVQGYSSAPIYEQALQTFGEQRPGQKAYIDSFFIDPYSGGDAANNFVPIDYTQYGTMADQAAAQRANELAIAQAGAGPSSVNYNLTSMSANPNLTVQPNDQIFNISPPEVQIAQQILATDPTNPDYNGAFQTVYNYQSQQAELDPYGQSTGYGITTDVVDAAGGIEAFLPGHPGLIDPTQQASSAITVPAEGITDTSTAGTGTQILNDLTEFGTGLASNTLAGSILLGPSYNVGGVNNPIETPTIAEMQASAPPGMTYNPSTGSYTDYSGTGGGLLGGSNVTGPSIDPTPTSTPTTFEGPIPTGTTLPTGSTVVNTYDGGFESRPAQSTDNDKPAGPGDTGYEQAQLLGNLQSGGTGIIYKDDRREVYLDGVLIGKPKSADSAEKMLREAKEKKAAASQPSPLPADTSVSAGMEVRALPNGTEYYVDAAGNFVGLK
jgi:hypothetical protein